MRIINVANAKGGCGKSTIAMSVAVDLARRGYSTLLMDLDSQAQITQWIDAGDGISSENTVASALLCQQLLNDIVQRSPHPNLDFVPSSEALEAVGHRLLELDSPQQQLAGILEPIAGRYDWIVFDSPNQISPIMANAIFITDLFLVPFESTKAVRAYANFYKLLLEIRGVESEPLVWPVLSNLSRQPGLRQHVIEAMLAEGIGQPQSEIRSCGYLARVDERQGSIFDYRPHSKGAVDMGILGDQILTLFGFLTAAEAA